MTPHGNGGPLCERVAGLSFLGACKVHEPPPVFPGRKGIHSNVLPPILEGCSPRCDQKSPLLMKGKKQKQQKRGKRSATLRVLHPPSLKSIVEFSYTVRYKNTTAAGASTILTSTFQPYNLIDAIFLVKNGANSVVSCVDSLRLVRLAAWAPPTSPSQASGANDPWASSNITLGFVHGVNFGRDRFVTDMSMTTTPAHVVLSPKRGETSAMYQSDGGNQPWTVSYAFPPNTIFDITMKVVLNMDAVATNTNTTLAVTASPDYTIFYFAELGNIAGVSTTLIPQGVDYIT